MEEPQVECFGRSRMSASCSTNHRLVSEQTPFAANSAERHATATEAEREENYDMFCDELDCNELEEIYQRVLADDLQRCGPKVCRAI